MARLQVLVAVLVEGDAAIEVQAFRRALGDRRLERIAPHVTLAPPSAVAEADVETVIGRLHRAARRETPFTLPLGPPASFVPIAPTVHLPVEDDRGRLAALQRHVAGPPLRAQRRSFVPHVTLVAGQEPERIAAACALLAGYRGLLEVSRLSLLVRPPGPGGWRTLDDVDLDGVRTVGVGPLSVELATGTVVGPVATSWGLQRTDGRDPARSVSPVEPAGTGVESARAGAGPDSADLVVTARREGAVVGSATGRTDAEQPLVMVDAGSRHQGIGTQLVREWQFRRRWRAATSVRLRPSISR